MELTYFVRYGLIPSQKIHNCLLVPDRYRINKDKKTQFYHKLEESILKEGFRNPILINCGYCPKPYEKKLPEEIRDQPDLLVCVRLGGSRLWVAQKHDMDIPCIINDFSGAYNNFELLKSNEHIGTKFKDKPKWMRRMKDGLVIAQLHHHHMIQPLTMSNIAS